MRRNASSEPRLISLAIDALWERRDHRAAQVALIRVLDDRMIDYLASLTPRARLATLQHAAACNGSPSPALARQVRQWVSGPRTLSVAFLELWAGKPWTDFGHLRLEERVALYMRQPTPHSASEVDQLTRVGGPSARAAIVACWAHHGGFRGQPLDEALVEQLPGTLRLDARGAIAAQGRLHRTGFAAAWSAEPRGPTLALEARRFALLSAARRVEAGPHLEVVLREAARLEPRRLSAVLLTLLNGVGGVEDAPSWERLMATPRLRAGPPSEVRLRLLQAALELARFPAGLIETAYAAARTALRTTPDGETHAVVHAAALKAFSRMPGRSLDVALAAFEASWRRSTTDDDVAQACRRTAVELLAETHPARTVELLSAAPLTDTTVMLWAAAAPVLARRSV